MHVLTFVQQCILCTRAEAMFCCQAGPPTQCTALAVKCLQTLEVVVLVSTPALTDGATISYLRVVMPAMAKLGCLSVIGTTMPCLAFKPALSHNSRCVCETVLSTILVAPCHEADVSGAACQVTTSDIKHIMILHRTAV